MNEVTNQDYSLPGTPTCGNATSTSHQNRVAPRSAWLSRPRRHPDRKVSRAFDSAALSVPLSDLATAKKCLPVRASHRYTPSMPARSKEGGPH
jgi:hypothetical protein